METPYLGNLLFCMGVKRGLSH